MSSTKINLGKVALTPKGEWNAATTYERLDVVSYQGSSYTVLKECIGQTPSEGEYYSLLASKGAKGEQGDSVDPDHINDLLQLKSNTDILINSDFRKPVNTRGKSSYEAYSSLRGTIDLWMSTGAKVTIMDDYVKVISVTDSSKWSRFIQMITFPMTAPNTYTLSILAKVNTATGTFVLRFCDKNYGPLQDVNGANIGVKVLNVTSGYELFSVTITPSGPALSGVFGVEVIGVGPEETGTTGSFDINIKAMKLELGSQQTLAHKINGTWVLNEPINYEYQYSRCSQYDLTNNRTGYKFNNVNMLDNPNFRINQRNETVYTALSKYTVDRWFLSRWSQYETGSATVTDEGISLAVGSGIIQKLDKDVLGDLDGKYITVSAIIGDELCTFTTIWDKTINWAPKTFDNGYQLAWNGVANAIQILNVSGSPTDIVKIAKMEVGMNQTLAHVEGNEWILNDTPPNYGLELLKCRRYYYQTWNNPLDFNGVLARPAMTKWRMQPIRFPVEMRCNPSITIFGAFEDSLGVSGNVTEWETNAMITGVTAVYKNSHGFTPSTAVGDPALTVGKFYAFHYSANADL